MKKIALYARCSTEEQNHASQLHECQEWISRCLTGPVEHYIDTASGGSHSRERFDAMMADLRKGRLQAVVCYKMDRLGRSLVHLVQTIAEFEAHHTAFVCTSQGIDTRAVNPAGRLQMHVLMAVSEFERSLIRERTRAGMDRARERGAAIGRPRVDPEALPSVSEWLTAKAGGESLRGFCRRHSVALSTFRRHVNDAR